MSDATPTRSVVLEMKDERRAMHDGYVFLDEKCLLLAGEMLRELGRYAALRLEFLAAQSAAFDALQRAVARHGLHGLQVSPEAEFGAARLVRTPWTLMGVPLQSAALEREPVVAPAALDGSAALDACRRAFAALFAAAAPLAATTGNLERLAFEYRRSVRRARALQDVLLPELDSAVRDLETRIEEAEQEDAIWMGQARR
ncbi:MAG: V-type ATP synthase subunit D [Burkholderiales bacterium]